MTGARPAAVNVPATSRLLAHPATLAALLGALAASTTRAPAWSRDGPPAGVPVTVDRFQAIIHDFVMLNALADTNAARGAITLATDTLRTVLSNKN